MRTHLADRPEELALLQAMQDEHARIDPLLAAVDGAFADRGGGHQHLGDNVDALVRGLHGHLGHEERDALPLIDQSLTQAEWEAFGNDQRRRIGIRGAAQLFPWLLDEAAPPQIQAVLWGAPAAAAGGLPADLAAPLHPPRPLGAIPTGRNPIATKQARSGQTAWRPHSVSARTHDNRPGTRTPPTRPLGTESTPEEKEPPVSGLTSWCAIEGS